MKIDCQSARKGFTLIELLVVISIIGLLSSVVLASLTTVRSKARDSQRVQEMRSIQKAIELYRSDNGHYPDTRTSPTPAAPCNGWTSFDSVTYGPCDIYTPNAADLWTALSPYLGRRPADPRPAGNTSGYLYISTAGGADYCFMVYLTPENLNNFADTLINPVRCGGTDSSGLCTTPGTGNGGTMQQSAIYVGSGAYAINGC